MEIKNVVNFKMVHCISISEFHLEEEKGSHNIEEQGLHGKSFRCVEYISRIEFTKMCFKSDI